MDMNAILSEAHYRFKGVPSLKVFSNPFNCTCSGKTNRHEHSFAWTCGLGNNSGIFPQHPPHSLHHFVSTYMLKTPELNMFQEKVSKPQGITPCMCTVVPT